MDEFEIFIDEHLNALIYFDYDRFIIDEQIRLMHEGLIPFTMNKLKDFENAFFNGKQYEVPSTNTLNFLNFQPDKDITEAQKMIIRNSYFNLSHIIFY